MTDNKRGGQPPKAPVATMRATSHGLTRTRLLRSGATSISPRDQAEALKAQARAKFTGHTLSKFVGKLTKKAFEKHGFSAATLLTDWRTIVGNDMAAYTAPERLKWPRGIEAYSDVTEDSVGRPGATLVVRVEPARALDASYKSRLLIERINAYFGYKAVSELRFVQAPVVQLQPQSMDRRLPPTQPLRLASPLVQAVDDEGLREALAKLEATMAARAKSKPK